MEGKSRKRHLEEKQSVNIRPQVVLNNFPENQVQTGNNRKCTMPGT